MTAMGSDQMQDLTARVVALETDLALLAASLRGGITTDRLVIVDRFGRERITLEVDQNDNASAFIRTNNRRGESTGVELSAGAFDRDEPCEGSIVMWLDGNVISRWEVRNP